VALTRLSRNYIRRLLKAVHAGDTKPPPDGRSSRTQRARPGQDHCDAYFSWVYNNVAEPLAEGVSFEDVEDDCVQKDPYSEWISGAVADPVVSSVGEQRWLPPITTGELYDQYRYQHKGTDDLASRAVFWRALFARLNSRQLLILASKLVQL